jgi:hypothetical protein
MPAASSLRDAGMTSPYRTQFACSRMAASARLTFEITVAFDPSGILFAVPVLAPWPAAGPALSIQQITANALKFAKARFLLFCGQDPAEPLVSCQWCEVSPRRQRLRVG